MPDPGHANNLISSGMSQPSQTEKPRGLKLRNSSRVDPSPNKIAFFPTRSCLPGHLLVPWHPYIIDAAHKASNSENVIPFYGKPQWCRVSENRPLHKNILTQGGVNFTIEH